uniref:Uncharacterized protein n=1 Tax=Strigamia maritima TaxID=126957 RepID=T1IX80_STRMM
MKTFLNVKTSILNRLTSARLLTKPIGSFAQSTLNSAIFDYYDVLIYFYSVFTWNINWRAASTRILTPIARTVSSFSCLYDILPDVMTS